MSARSRNINDEINPFLNSNGHACSGPFGNVIRSYFLVKTHMLLNRSTMEKSRKKSVCAGQVCSGVPKCVCVSVFRNTDTDRLDFRVPYSTNASTETHTIALSKKS